MMNLAHELKSSTGRRTSFETLTLVKGMGSARSYCFALIWVSLSELANEQLAITPTLVLEAEGISSTTARAALMEVLHDTLAPGYIQKRRMLREHVDRCSCNACTFICFKDWARLQAPFSSLAATLPEIASL